MFSIILYMTNPKSSIYYNNKINELNSQYLLVAEEIENSFPLSKTYPDIKSYTDNYNTYLSDEEHIKSELSILKNELQNDIENTKNDEQEQITHINNLENKNNELKNKINQLKNKNEGAIGFYYDFKNKYNVEINKTIIFFIITLIMIIYLFSDKNNIETITSPVENIILPVKNIINTTTTNVNELVNEVVNILDDVKNKLSTVISNAEP